MSTERLNPDDLEVAPGFTHERLQGWVPDLASEDELRGALEKAFDYRGDVKITRKDGSVVEGYLYDRKQAATLSGSLARVLPADGSPRVSIPYSDIAALVFSERDPAAGKSWEAWVRKYWEKKAAGEPAEIKPEAWT
ncbi:MAG: hypothetical protein JO270_06195 [Acidobacteriaceae bacterium]|nr:hypothetical protein [Acidobacteriaceae bacterium]MBV8569553.1 hypothetical protein [Acidobacteriaceae bacterium]